VNHSVLYAHHLIRMLVTALGDGIYDHGGHKLGRAVMYLGGPLCLLRTSKGWYAHCLCVWTGCGPFPGYEVRRSVRGWTTPPDTHTTCAYGQGVVHSLVTRKGAPSR
jgi:hypothetical protein